MSLEEKEARKRRTRWKRLQSLSPPALLVVEQLLAGKTNAEIATALGRSVKTVKSHLTQVYSATGCANVRQFLVWYFSGERLWEAAPYCDEAAAESEAAVDRKYGVEDGYKPGWTE